MQNVFLVWTCVQVFVLYHKSRHIQLTRAVIHIFTITLSGASTNIITVLKLWFFHSPAPQYRSSNNFFRFVVAHHSPRPLELIHLIRQNIRN